MTDETSPSPREKTTETPRRTPDTYWLLEGVTLLIMNFLGGLYVRGEEHIPQEGAVLMVSNHVSYLDPVSIGDASPRRVVFMAKAEIFQNRFLGYLLRGVDAFPVRRGAADRTAFKNTLEMLGEKRTVCIFPEGTRGENGILGDAEPGAALFAIKTGCPVVPVYVDGSDRMLDRRGRLHRAPITVNFGEPFYLPRGSDRDVAAKQLMTAIAHTRDTMGSLHARRIWPHWIRKKREGSRATQKIG